MAYIAPSGVQKERIKPEHMFVLPYPQSLKPEARVFLRRPTATLNESACTPLFWNAFELRDAGSCIHTHSQHAVMVTLLWPGETFSISHQEVGDCICNDIQIINQSTLFKMIKGIMRGGTGRALSYLDTLTVPIIDNVPHEEDLRESMREVCEFTGSWN
jgi:methylthioribulose-1-phosphate dehydratase